MLREIAFWIGALVVFFWAARDFTQGLPMQEIRYATQYDRSTRNSFIRRGNVRCLFISSITIFAAYGLVHAVLLPQVPSLAQWEPAKTIPLATTGVLVVIAVLPEVPVIRDWIGQLRLIARALALYPYAFLRMSRLLSGNFNPKDDPERAVERELARYGASIDALHRQFSPSVCRGLWEFKCSVMSFDS